MARAFCRFWGRCDILEAAVGFLIYLIVIIVVAAVILWAVGKFFPSVYPPARYIVGAFALIAILLAVLKVLPKLEGAMP